MELKQAQHMIASLIEEDHSAKMYENYSGRGMFGKKTTGVVTGKYYDPDPETGIKRDTMGKDFIYY